MLGVHVYKHFHGQLASEFRFPMCIAILGLQTPRNHFRIARALPMAIILTAICDRIVVLIWDYMFFNETCAALIQTCSSVRKASATIWMQHDLCLKVRAGNYVRTPVDYPDLRSRTICLQFPNMFARAPAQLYECLSGLRNQHGVLIMKLQFLLLRKSALEYLMLLLKEFLDSVDEDATCSRQIRCEFPLGIRHSSNISPAPLEKSGVYMFMHQILHYFSIDLECVYMKRLITQKDVVLWLESQ